ncbi:hypothetical protein OG866_28250 [Streptomyces sp. NBC_00663]|uniref:hypothetical protein n=1 Tax=Streptomyces sp. NBC_00663 TaxID=2975801 RepID=UPI002E34E616|nr:hypothetical protein [Streptomyces sp. NBC_00663]
MFLSLTRPTPCPDCRTPADWVGVQVLVGDALRWDVEVACGSCGFAVAECGGELSDGVRESLLAEHGAAVLHFTTPPRRLAVLRVLRESAGVGIAEAKEALERVLAGEYSGTPPEMELLARRLRAVGVDVVVSAQAARRCSG